MPRIISISKNKCCRHIKQLRITISADNKIKSINLLITSCSARCLPDILYPISDPFVALAALAKTRLITIARTNHENKIIA